MLFFLAFFVALTFSAGINIYHTMCPVDWLFSPHLPTIYFLSAILFECYFWKLVSCSNHMHYSSAGWANYISDKISAASCLDPWAGWVALILIHTFLSNKLNMHVSFLVMKCGPCFSGYLVSFGLCLGLFSACWIAGMVSLVGIGIWGFGGWCCIAWCGVYGENVIVEFWGLWEGGCEGIYFLYFVSVFRLNAPCESGCIPGILIVDRGLFFINKVLLFIKKKCMSRFSFLKLVAMSLSFPSGHIMINDVMYICGFSTDVNIWCLILDP